MLKRTLVTGGAGFIGHHLVRKLLTDFDHEIVVVDDFSNPAVTLMLDNWHDKVRLYRVDIRNKEAMADIVKQERIRTCIHLAAKISVIGSIQNPSETIDVNINGTLSVLNACSANNVENFVFASSAAVYGDAAVVPISEDSVPNPLSPYGASKIAGEALATSFKNCGNIANVISLRFFNVYGRGQSAEYAGVITKFMERLSKHLPPIIYGDGQQSRDFVHVDDVVNSLALAANAKVSGTFNVGTGKPITIDELARNMIKGYDLDIEPLYRNGIRGDIRQSYANIEKASSILRFTIQHDINLELPLLLKGNSLRRLSHPRLIRELEPDA